MEPADRPLVAVGHFDADERGDLEEAAREATFQARFAESAREAIALLEQEPAHVIVVRDRERLAESLGLEARAQARLAQVPIIAMADELGDLTFAEVFSWGGDDATRIGQSWPLVTRLRALPRAEPEIPIASRGTVLVSDPNRARRVILARVLRNAGYAIEFATSADDTLERIADRAPVLVVANAEASDAPAALVEAARARGSSARWIIMCPPRELAKHRPVIESLGDATVTDAFAPPENLVFVANELDRWSDNDKRASRRLLYGTTVVFRGAGRDEDDVGYSYNISLRGLYVRTLAPPVDPVVWLELRPPRTERLVRLEGRVAWRRPFGPSGHATVPPGFGVEIVDGARSDLDAWTEGYVAFSEALGLPAA